MDIAEIKREHNCRKYHTYSKSGLKKIIDIFINDLKKLIEQAAEERKAVQNKGRYEREDFEQKMALLIDKFNEFVREERRKEVDAWFTRRFSKERKEKNDILAQLPTFDALSINADTGSFVYNNSLLPKREKDRWGGRYDISAQEMVESYLSRFVEESPFATTLTYIQLSVGYSALPEAKIRKRKEELAKLKLRLSVITEEDVNPEQEDIKVALENLLDTPNFNDNRIWEKVSIEKDKE